MNQTTGETPVWSDRWLNLSSKTDESLNMQHFLFVFYFYCNDSSIFLNLSLLRSPIVNKLIFVIFLSFTVLWRLTAKTLILTRFAAANLCVSAAAIFPVQGYKTCLLRQFCTCSINVVIKLQGMITRIIKLRVDVEQQQYDWRLNNTCKHRRGALE